MTTTLSTPDPPVAMGSPQTTGDSLVDLAFADLICEDDELLEAEFEAIITGFWDGPGRTSPVLVRTGPGRSTALDPQVQGRHTLPRGTLTSRRRAGRQRSPPPQADPEVAVSGASGGEVRLCR